MQKINIKIENEKINGDKIYFDLVLNPFPEIMFKINNCFAEKGKYGDWMLRLPTKKVGENVCQVNYLDDATFEDACKKVRNYFKEE